MLYIGPGDGEYTRRRAAHTQRTDRSAGSIRLAQRVVPPPHPARPVHGFPLGVDDDFFRADRNDIHPADLKTTQFSPGGQCAQPRRNKEIGN